MGKVTGGAHEKGFEFAKGGNTKMYGPGYAGPAPEGVTARQSKDSGKGSGKFAAGGKTKMFGQGSARTQEPGVTARKSQ